MYLKMETNQTRISIIYYIINRLTKITNGQKKKIKSYCSYVLNINLIGVLYPHNFIIEQEDKYVRDTSIILIHQSSKIHGLKKKMNNFGIVLKDKDLNGQK